MTDDHVRTLERGARHDPQARVELAAARIRSGRGVVWLWVELPELSRSMDVQTGLMEDQKVVAPSPALSVEVDGFSSGGEARIYFTSEPEPEPPPPPKKGWALACLCVEDAAFGREAIPESANLAGPLLLDIESGQLVVPCSATSLDGFVGLTIPMPKVSLTSAHGDLLGATP